MLNWPCTKSRPYSYPHFQLTLPIYVSIYLNSMYCTGFLCTRYIFTVSVIQGMEFQCKHKNQFYCMQNIFLSGTKCLWLPQYINKFLAWHKRFGPAQNILGPVKGQVFTIYFLYQMSLWLSMYFLTYFKGFVITFYYVGSYFM